MAASAIWKPKQRVISFYYKYDGNGNQSAKTGIQGLNAGSSVLDIGCRYDVREALLEECLSIKITAQP